MQNHPGLVTFYDTQPGNECTQGMQQSPQWAKIPTQMFMAAVQSQNASCLPVIQLCQV